MNSKPIVLTGVVSSFALMCVAAATVDFPRIVKATGYVMPSAGVIRVTSPQAAVVTGLLVREQSQVRKGEILGHISFERMSAASSVEERQAYIVRQKSSMLGREIALAEELSAASGSAARTRIRSLQQEAAKSRIEVELANKRVTDLIGQLARHQQLREVGFLSVEALETKRGEITDQQMKVKSLERQQLALERELQAQKEELRLIALRAAAQKSQLSRDLSSAQQELNEYSARAQDIVAPVAGYVTQLITQVGQPVRPDVPILSIVPDNSELQVLLLVPSKAIGFIRAGQRVSLRYQAFPHEHYGRQYGHVREVASAASAPAELMQYIRVEEPTYLVHVALPARFLDEKGHRFELVPGMLVDADVELDRPKIYQWLLQPLYRLGGRV